MSQGCHCGARAIPSTTRISILICCRLRPRGRKSLHLANAGGDMINAMKQAKEFGLSGADQRLVSLLLSLLMSIT